MIVSPRTAVQSGLVTESICGLNRASSPGPSPLRPNERARSSPGSRIRTCGCERSEATRTDSACATPASPPSHRDVASPYSAVFRYPRPEDAHRDRAAASQATEPVAVKPPSGGASEHATSSNRPASRRKPADRERLMVKCGVDVVPPCIAHWAEHGHRCQHGSSTQAPGGKEGCVHLDSLERVIERG